MKRINKRLLLILLLLVILNTLTACSNDNSTSELDSDEYFLDGGGVKADGYTDEYSQMFTDEYIDFISDFPEDQIKDYYKKGDFTDFDLSGLAREFMKENPNYFPAYSIDQIEDSIRVIKREHALEDIQYFGYDLTPEFGIIYDVVKKEDEVYGTVTELKVASLFKGDVSYILYYGDLDVNLLDMASATCLPYGTFTHTHPTRNEEVKSIYYVASLIIIDETKDSIPFDDTKLSKEDIPDRIISNLYELGSIYNFFNFENAKLFLNENIDLFPADITDLLGYIDTSNSYKDSVFNGSNDIGDKLISQEGKVLDYYTSYAEDIGDVTEIKMTDGTYYYHVIHFGDAEGIVVGGFARALALPYSYIEGYDMNGNPLYGFVLVSSFIGMVR